MKNADSVPTCVLNMIKEKQREKDLISLDFFIIDLNKIVILHEIIPTVFLPLY